VPRGTGIFPERGGQMSRVMEQSTGADGGD